MSHHLLLTGRPGVGKTTLVRRVLQKLDAPLATGFYTREIRPEGQRTGFQIVTLAGETATLAHVDIQSRHCVGRYGVDVAALERVALPGLEPVPGTSLIVIDEIGKMECFSRVFREAVLRTLEAQTPLLATIALRGDRFIEGLKARRDVTVIEVTPSNRDGLAGEIAAALKEGLHGTPA